MSLVPFQRHSANVDELYSCGAGLLGSAAAALDNATLTSQTYQPAIDNWDGMCAPELANARNPIIRGADEAHNALAWASVVASYWADRVENFNSAVDRIMETVGNDPHFGATGVDGEPPSAEAVDAARFAAEQRWWTAYNEYILDGEDEAAAMLRDGPTDQHLAVLGEAGVLPPAPPGAINTLNWAGHLVNGIMGGLGAYSAWRGSHWYSSVRGRPNTSNAAYWRLQQSLLSSDARYHHNRMQGAEHDLRSGRTWVNGQWTRPGHSALVSNYYQAADAHHSATQRAAQAGASSQTHAAAAGRWGTAARAAGPVGHVLTAGTSAWDQWSQDAGRNDLSTDDQVVRAGTQAAATTGGAAAGAWAGAKGGAVVGAAIGSVFPGPGTAIGAVAGGIIGGAAGGWLGSEAGGALADAGMEGVTNAYNGAKDAVSGAASTVKGWFGG